MESRIQDPLGFPYMGRFLCLSFTNRPFVLKGHVTTFLWKWKLWFCLRKTISGSYPKQNNVIIVIWFFNPALFSLIESVRSWSLEENVIFKYMNYLFLNTNFALKRQGKCWKVDVVTFTAHQLTIKRSTRYKQKVVLAVMLEGKSMPSNLAANTNHTALLKNQSAIKCLPLMRFLSNFGCKVTFMCSVNFWHHQDSKSMLKGSIGHMTS